MPKHVRNKIRVYLHFVWTTRERLPLITADVERDLYRYIASVCKDCKCEVLAVGGMPDHVHLYVAFPNTLNFSQLMRDVKGGSSRFMSERLKKEDWFAWQKNYGVFSTRKKDIPIVTNYILNQKQYHAEGKLWPEVEETFEEGEEEE